MFETLKTENTDRFLPHYPFASAIRLLAAYDLNHFFCFSMRHLDHIAQIYASYYNALRSLQSLGNVPPRSRGQPRTIPDRSGRRVQWSIEEYNTPVEYLTYKQSRHFGGEQYGLRPEGLWRLRDRCVHSVLESLRTIQ